MVVIHTHYYMYKRVYTLCEACAVYASLAFSGARECPTAGVVAGRHWVQTGSPLLPWWEEFTQLHSAAGTHLHILWQEGTGVTRPRVTHLLAAVISTEESPAESAQDSRAALAHTHTIFLHTHTTVYVRTLSYTHYSIRTYIHGLHVHTVVHEGLPIPATHKTHTAVCNTFASCMT